METEDRQQSARQSGWIRLIIALQHEKPNSYSTRLFYGVKLLIQTRDENNYECFGCGFDYRVLVQGIDIPN